jgi:hypothetical protein
MLQWPSAPEVNSGAVIDFGPVRFGASRRMLQWPSAPEVNSGAEHL